MNDQQRTSLHVYEGTVALAGDSDICEPHLAARPITRHCGGSLHTLIDRAYGGRSLTKLEPYIARNLFTLPRGAL